MDFAASTFEIKTLSDSGEIAGVLAGFDNIDHGGDQLLFGAFAKTLAARGTNPLPMLLHHDMSRPIGAWKSWEEQPGGLFVSGKMTLSTRDAQEAHALASDGALTGLSIGWEPKRTTRDPTTGARVVHEAALYEGSLVTIPMNDKGRVTSIKAIGGARDIEDLLRDTGLSGRRAKAAASAAWRAISESEDDDAAGDQLAALFKASTARIAGRNGGY